MKLKDALAGKLSEKELAILTGGFDVLGDIAIIEVEKGLGRKQKLIAKTLLETHNHIKVVLKKTGAHYGKFRRQKMTWLAGEKRKVTEYKESGTRMRLDVEKCYFSPRLGTERFRIANLVAPGERVLVMFSGVAPYQIIIAKHSKAKEVVGVELNPVAHKFALENVKLNKLTNVICIKGDCRKVVPKLGQFDRVMMCLPKENYLFLDVALKAVKSGGFLHFYCFEKEGEFSLASDKVLKAAEQYNIACEVQRVVKAGQHSPRVFRVCVDSKIMHKVL